MPQKTKNVRDLLIAETLRQIEAVGPEKLSLRKIAAACGVTHATAYKYFENKQALIHLCRERVGKRLIAYMRRAARTAGEPFVAFMKAYLHYMTRHAQYHYLIHLYPHPLPKSAASPKKRAEAVDWDTVADYLTRCGVEEKDFSDILMLTSTMLNGLITLLNRHALAYDGDPADLVDLLVLEPLSLYPKTGRR